MLNKKKNPSVFKNLPFCAMVSNFAMVPLQHPHSFLFYDATFFIFRMVFTDRLVSNKSSYFSLMIECFVQNIKEKDSRDKPDVLVRNIRQFMSGMKNYLFNRREPDVDEAMDKVIFLLRIPFYV